MRFRASDSPLEAVVRDLGVMAYEDALVLQRTLVDQRRDDLIPDTLLLVTCYPFDALDANGPLRFVVEAKPVNRPVQKDTVAAL